MRSNTNLCSLGLYIVESRLLLVLRESFGVINPSDVVMGSRRGKTLQFSSRVFDRIPTDSCRFSTEEIMVAQCFNFANKFHEHEVLASTFAYFGDNFPTRRRCWASPKFGGRGGQCLPCPWPVCSPTMLLCNSVSKL